ncbi:CD109 antigen isoform X2 [Pangasianodon hypophthalmus]|uniref:CD109 antigen isoform X2 n=1 Tax=Pangasianodon hypophthalmus TaxID=310915 RepID=UPI002307A369|nr:CD109 antigen isoform X2 [Pangasianodon hypophthalmus]
MGQLHIVIMIGFFTVIGGAQNPTSPAPLQSPSYLISVSRVLRSGVPTKVSITILAKSSVLVISEIMQGNNSLGRAQTTVEGGSTKLQVLPPIPENDSSYWYPYKLIVNGYIGQTLVFSNSTMLQYSPRSVSILLQTDKPKYKPGQAVKIRALVITPDGKPCNKQIDIIIMDPRENLIRQWLAVDTFLGETANEFQLSQNPPLGTWKIIATVNEVTQEKIFTVSHYVLPKFEVLLDTPDVLYCEENLTYTVTAQYLYGKPVAGKMSVVYVHSFHGITSSHEDWKMIDGKAELSFDVPSLYQKKKSADYMSPFYEEFDTSDYIDINVQVTELLTGVTYNSSARVSVAMYRYNLEFQQYPSTIKPSLKFSAQLKLSTYNRGPLTAEDQSRSVTLTVSQEHLTPWTLEWENSANFKTRNSSHLEFIASTFIYPNGNISVKSLQLPVPADGVIPFQIELSENVAMLKIEAQYEDIQKSLQLYRRYSSPSGTYIQLRSRSSPQIGQSLYMTVESNFPLTEFHYMVISRGQVVAAGNVTSSYFSLSPDPSWVPLANVLVYCVLPDGEIVNDVMDVSFTKMLRNNVSVSWAKEHAEPAENVSLSISVAEPRSLVGILVVDKAGQDSDRSNDFTEKRVIEELATYTTDVTLMDGMEISDPHSVFMVSGITVLTDASLNAENSYARPELREGFPMLLTWKEQADQEPRQRRNFPETWLWLDTTMGESTTAAFTLTVPDSMTSWVATAFVISENLGLGLSAPAELRVSKDFFVSLNLPAYLVRGELLLLEISLFNYMDLDLEVLVTVNESSMFEFVTSGGDESLLAGMRHVSVWRQKSAMVLFAIRATQLGQMPISVKAMSFYASDLVSQTILVKPEGRQQSFTQTLFLEFDAMTTSLSREVEFHFPSAAVPGSLSAQVTAVGDILGPSISGLDSLIQMPYGCGEQNMIHFAPNVYVLQYLSRSGHTDEETRAKALSYMTQGYERELSYQRMDGSFSAFGDSDPSGSTWLSAFVLRCFLQAQQFIFIDTAILLRTTNWLRAQQRADGSFAEPGRVIHTELQGGLDGPVSLTAYVLMALLEDVKYKHMYDSEVSAAMSYLTSKLNQGISSNYSLCLVTYTLTLAKSPSAAIALTKLMSRAQMHDGVPMWSTGGSGVSESWQPRSADIEMASYALLSLYMLGSVEQALSLMKWLSQQRNHLGGYGSTQDTVIALQALSAFALLSSTEQINLNITVSTQTATVATFSIDRTNYLLYQSQEIEAEKHLQFQVTAVGRGFALFQLTTFYNVETQELSRRRRAHTCEAFDLYIHVMDKDMYNVNVYICFRLCENQELNQTGMAILDVGLLTGFSLAQSGVPINEQVRRVETSPGKVILYLDSVTKAETCVEIPATLEFKVTDVHDAVVTIYDYYEPRRRAVGTYTSETRRDMPFCFFCGEDCSQCADLGISVFDGIISSHLQQGLVQSLALLLLITFSLCF